MSIRTVLVEDVTSFAKALHKYIEVCGSEVECLGMYGTAEEALASIPSQSPDVSVVDINLPGMSGIELVGRLKLAAPTVLCLILTTYEDSNLIFEALKAGACGYLLKRSPAEEIVSAIVQVREGGSPISPQVARRVLGFLQRQASSPSVLSPLELTILERLAEGSIYRKIAAERELTVEAVGKTVRGIYEKLHRCANESLSPT